MRRIVFVLLGVLPFFCLGEENSLEVRPSLQWYGYASHQVVADSSYNSSNTLFQIPDRVLASDMRPKIRIKSLDGNFIIVARAKILTELASSEISERRKAERPKSSSKVLDAFVEWNAGEVALFSFGLQNYQWGAAESLNPSNRIFHSSGVIKDQLGDSSSKHIARVNLTWMKNFSTVFMTENREMAEPEIFRAEEEFQTTSLLKNEMSWNDGSDYIGIVFGAGEKSGQWVGEYFNVTLMDGLTFYGDASHRSSSDAWYPEAKESVETAGVVVTEFTQRKKTESSTETLGVAGLRYSFEGGSDLRIEAIHNSAGWSKSEFDLVASAFNSTTPAQVPLIEKNAARWLQPGLELKGRGYGLFSFRAADLLSVKDLTLTLRCLHSTTDASGSTLTGIDYAVRDSSLTLIASVRANYGEKDSDLNNLVSSSTLAGLRYDF